MSRPLTRNVEVERPGILAGMKWKRSRKIRIVRGKFNLISTIFSVQSRTRSANKKIELVTITKRQQCSGPNGQAQRPLRQ
jgi:hypothetical protein